jgi:hypothetical protein
MKRFIGRGVIVLAMAAAALSMGAPEWAAFLGGMFIAYQAIPERPL